jgi:hypothetical protein
MGTLEHRLHVIPTSEARVQTVFFPRSFADRTRSAHYLCGSCSIIFAPASEAAILAGNAGNCKNCGAVNQL